MDVVFEQKGSFRESDWEDKMEKQISVWSYWLGLLSAAVALVLRGLTTVGFRAGFGNAAGGAISYNTFLHGAALLLLLSIASSLVNSGHAKS